MIPFTLLLSTYSSAMVPFSMSAMRVSWEVVLITSSFPMLTPLYGKNYNPKNEIVAAAPRAAGTGPLLPGCTGEYHLHLAHCRLRKGLYRHAEHRGGKLCRLAAPYQHLQGVAVR